MIIIQLIVAAFATIVAFSKKVKNKISIIIAESSYHFLKTNQQPVLSF